MLQQSLSVCMCVSHILSWRPWFIVFFIFSDSTVFLLPFLYSLLSPRLVGFDGVVCPAVDAEHKMNSTIFGGSSSHNVELGCWFLFFMLHVLSLHIDYGFWFCVFIESLCGNMCVSPSICVSWAFFFWLLFFCLFCFVLFCFVWFVLPYEFYYYSLDNYLFSNERQKG